MGQSVEISWTGDVDLVNINDIRGEIDHALNTPDVEQLVIDLSGVGFVDSLGLGMLVYAVDSGGTRGVAVSIRHVPDRTMNLIRVAGLDDILPIDAG
ncbi:STAS domain-containing protein [uncultured Jatrophihabitans sp.]|uniref:STAS domain-containing protein n=1 Tax=uncultured Jatrophihabitans sp. TaxID=1610747 RepID=UPI0035CC3824